MITRKNKLKETDMSIIPPQEAEELIKTACNAVLPPTSGLAEDTLLRLAGVMEGDHNSLGQLLNLLDRYLIARHRGEAEELKPAMVIACADHGVTAEGISAYPPETSVEMARNYVLAQGGAANVFAAYARAQLYAVDMGLREHEEIPGLADFSLGSGTENIAHGPAMSREQAMCAVAVGIGLAEQLIAEGANCLLPGEMGIGNTTSQACLAAAFCNLTPEEATGRGTFQDDSHLKRKAEVVGQALSVNGLLSEDGRGCCPENLDGLDVLSRVGGFEFGCLAGLMLGGAACGVPTILDGANTAAAALIAQALAPEVTSYLIASQLGGENSHAHALSRLGLTPYLTLDLRLSEGAGSSIVVRFLGLLLLALKNLDLLAAHEEAAEIDFTQVAMPKEAPTLTDRTFNFYLNTMPSLDEGSCREAARRLDELAKPARSLGYLEDIAAELAGVFRDPLPPFDPPAVVLNFAPAALSPVQEQLTHAFAASIEATVAIARLRKGLPATAAFNFGREQAEEISFDMPIIVVTMSEATVDDPLGTAARVLAETLLKGPEKSLEEHSPHELATADAPLAWPAEEFLQHAPAAYHGPISAVIGAILAAAHNTSLVVTGDAATEIIARYTEQLCPEVRPYILHLQPRLLPLGLTAGGGLLGCLGLHLIEASLSVLYNMKTFAETKVSQAKTEQV